MEETGQGNAVRSRWRRIRTVGRWLNSPGTNADQLVTALLAWVVITVIGAAVGGTLSALEVIHLDGSVTVPILAAAVAGALSSGCLFGVNLGRRRREHHASIPSNGSALTELRELEAELTTAESELSKLELKSKTLVRLETYAELLNLTLANDLGSDLDEERIFLYEPSKTMERFVGVAVHISLWQIGRDRNGRGRWEPSHWPTHAPHERDDFRVPLDESWVAYTQRQYNPNDVFSLTDISEAISRGSRGADLNSFLRHDFRSVSCCSLFPHEDPRQNQPCLIMLAQTPAAFSRHEDRLLQLFARVLGLHLELQSMKGRLEGGIAP